MKPIEFKEQNCVFAENQPQYLPLPAHKVNEPEGRVIFCWKMSFKERIKLLITGKIWCSLMTFNQPLQPNYFSVNKSDFWDT